jgi:hypothetical protein
LVFPGLVEVALDHRNRVWWMRVELMRRETKEIGKETTFEGAVQGRQRGRKSAACAKATSSPGWQTVPLRRHNWSTEGVPRVGWKQWWAHSTVVVAQAIVSGGTRLRCHNPVARVRVPVRINRS